MPRSDGESSRGVAALAVDRRSYLKLAGVAAGSAGLLSGSASAAFTRRGLQFNSTVNMVEDAGCDPTGNEPCDQQITDAADDYTLLKFPAGKYKITEKNAILGLTNVGFLGVGDARFVVPENFNEKVLVVDRGTGVLFEGIDIDQRADGATPALHLAADDDLRVHDVELIGQGIHPDSIPKGQPGYSPGVGGDKGNPRVHDFFYPLVRSESGTGVVTDLSANNHGLMGSYNAGNGRSGIWVGIGTKGTITFRDCHIEEFGSNGCYTSRTYGVVQYEGGTYRNNDNNQIRLGSENSYIDGAILEVDADASEAPNPYEALNYRGVRIEMGHNYTPVDVSIRNCDISVRSTPHTSGAIVAQSTAGHFEVENTRIAVDPDNVRAVFAYKPDGGVYDPPAEPHSAILDNVSITGEAAGKEAVRLVNRPDSVIENCCIQQTGMDRDGVLFSNTSSAEVSDSTINVTGRQVIEDGSSVSQSNLSDSGSCSSPVTAQGDNLPHKLSFVSDGGKFTYSFTVSGDLGKSTARGASIDDNDTLSGSTATGQGNGGTDSYGFSGDLLGLDLDGDATVYLDDDVIDPDDYAGPGDDLPRKLSFVSDGGNFTYSFTVSGDLGKSTARGASIDDNDTISGSSATGQGSGGADSYGFSGDLLGVDFDGDARVYLDGDVIDPDDYGDILTIQSSDKELSYAVSVSDRIAKSRASGGSINDNDTITGSTASGEVDGGTDAYALSGDIESLDFGSDGIVALNGDTIDPSDYPDNVLSIEGAGSRVDYQFTVSGDLEKSTANGASIDGDTISGASASGHVSAGVDSYVFDGEITNFYIEDESLTVSLNGKPMELGDYSTDVLSIEGDGDFEYTVATSEGIEKSTANGGSINANDVINGSTATGQGSGGTDSYALSGDLEVLAVDGDATATLDGKTLDPSDYYDNVLSIEGTGPRADYELTVSVSGDLEKSTANGADFNPQDEISGSTASGFVNSGNDSYTFSGEVDSLSLDGDATVTLNGTEIDPDEYRNVLTFVGQGSRADYTVSVSGDLEKSTANGADFNPQDEISGSAASGFVNSGNDSYTFSGEVDSLSLDGDATVTLNGTEIDPDEYRRTLSFVSDGGKFTYSFSVSGDLEKSTARGASIDPNDTISGNSATGQGNGGIDSYEFSGTIESFDFDGDATVYLDDRAVDPDRLG